MENNKNVRALFGANYASNPKQYYSYDLVFKKFFNSLSIYVQKKSILIELIYFRIKWILKWRTKF